MREEEQSAIVAVHLPSEHWIGVADGQEVGQEAAATTHEPSEHFTGVSEGQEEEDGQEAAETAQVLSEHLTGVDEGQGHANWVVAQVPSEHNIGMFEGQVWAWATLFNKLVNRKTAKRNIFLNLKDCLIIFFTFLEICLLLTKEWLYYTSNFCYEIVLPKLQIFTLIYLL